MVQLTDMIKEESSQLLIDKPPVHIDPSHTNSLTPWPNGSYSHVTRAASLASYNSSLEKLFQDLHGNIT